MRAAADESWAKLTTANDDIDAQLLVGLLEEASIPTRTIKDRSGPGDYLYGGSNPRAPVVIHVHPRHVDEAKRVLSELGSETGSESSATPAIKTTRWGWPTVLAIAIVALIVLAFLLQQRELVF